MPTRPRILCVIGSFWPGNDASGPNQSFKALTKALEDQFEFHLLARATPSSTHESSTVPNPDFVAHYLSGGQILPRHLLKAIRDCAPDLIWLNGFFDREFTIPILIAKRLGLLSGKRFLLSPRGEFGAAAMRLKSTRKRSYLRFVQAAGLLRDVTLHATSQAEAQMIETVLPKQNVEIAPNIRAPLNPLPHQPSETLRLVFLGRIAPIKNLAFALRVLQDVSTPVQFDIYGPVEDGDHWRMCLAMAEELPPHIGVTHHGTYASSALPGILANADLLFLPSAGENFGHAIFEALSCGVPALLSDRTPWRDLTADKAGWDLPLHTPQDFAARIDGFAALTEDERASWRAGARHRAEQLFAQSDAVAGTSQLLKVLAA